MKRIIRLTAPVAALILGAGLLQPAATATIDNRLVDPNPANFTPQVLDDGVGHSAIYALDRSGGLIYAGGRFAKVTNASGSIAYNRANLMAFNAKNGAMSTSFAPVVAGDVWSVVATDKFVYVGGTFSTVNGTARRAVAKLDRFTGRVISAFNPHLGSGRVTEMKIVRGRLIVAGSFPRKIIALNRKTGADTGYIKAAVTGNVGDGATQIFRFSVNPAHTRLVGVGNFTSVGGQSRTRAVMFNLGDSSTSVNPWYYEPFSHRCRGQRLNYVQDVDFSPSGSFFVVVSTGWVPLQGGVGRDVCDVAARFETNIANPFRPTWMNYTGGDTLHAVAVTGSAVYAQGHQRWFDNPQGVDSQGPGAISRPGIAALKPSDGSVLNWNPTKTRAVGGRELLLTEKGLWVGSDGAQFNGERRDNLAFCPAR